MAEVRAGRRLTALTLRSAWDAGGYETGRERMKKKESLRGADAADPFGRAKARADEAWKAAQAAEKAWMAAAKARTPEAWREAVDGVGDRTVRIHAACVVWWDFFGSRPASSAWTHLDGYKSAWQADRVADAKSVRKALTQIGYPERLAERRVKIEEPAGSDIAATE